MFAPSIKQVKAESAEPPHTLHGPRSAHQRVLQGVLAHSGRPLSQEAQESAGKVFGFNFSRVRIHDNPVAQHSALALGARAWTWGHHVVLGANAGPDTLNHELTHVVQQSAAGGGEPGPGPSEQEMEWEARAATRTPRPPSLRAPFRTVQLQHEGDDARMQLREPGIGRSSVRQTFGVLGQWEFQLTPTDQFAIVNYLTAHQFSLIRLRPALDGQNVTMDEIVNRLRPLVSSFIGRDKIESYVDERRRRMLFTNLGMFYPNLQDGSSVPGSQSPGPPAGPPPPRSFILPLPPGPTTSGTDATHVQGWQTVLTAGGQITLHVDRVTGRPASPAQDGTLQVSVARNYLGHADRESGPEMQGLVQLGLTTTGQWTVLAGGQYTQVVSLLNGLLQVGTFLQVLAGVAASGGSVSAQIQPSVGLQAVANISRVDSLGAQLMQGATFSPGSGSAPTNDTGVGGFWSRSW